MSEIKAIETSYKGYRFRSRLEARWAVYFDALGISYEYEKEGFDMGVNGRYLPDFWLSIPNSPAEFKGAGFWVEIKGNTPTLKEKEMCKNLAIGTGHCVFLFVGLPDTETLKAYKWFLDGRVIWNDESFNDERYDVIPYIETLLGDISKSTEARKAAKSARFEFDR